MDNYIIYPKQLRKHIIPVERNRCFFLMPFSEEFDVIYGTIKQCLNDAEYICNRADEITGSTPILTKILTEIMRSQYIIVDLTNGNPNVFYELGIAHTIKEARNVLLLKQKNYVAPFDIRHLTYQEYDPNNLKLLTSNIRTFLNECKSKNAFYDALCQHGIINYIDENNNDVIELILSELHDSTIECFTHILLGESNDMSQENISESFNAFCKMIENIIFEKNYKIVSILLDIYYTSIQSIKESDYVRELISQMLYDFFEQSDIPDALMREYKTKLALMMAKREMYLDTVLPWILDYFSRSKTATIDLNRYNVESYLMTTTSSKVNDAIINRLCDSDCYVREHMSDIIGEKKLLEAAPLLFTQLSKEENFFTAQSMMEAIGKIKQAGGLEVIQEWINTHKQEIIDTNQLFVLKHAFIAISSLDTTPNKLHIQNFNNEFGSILEKYYII